MKAQDVWLSAGARLTHDSAMRRMEAAKVVLLGEQHDRASDHRWQVLVIAGLAAQRPGLSVGFEMFPRRFQRVLDDWGQGKLSETAFLQAVSWSEVWGFDPDLYLPIFHLCRDLGLPMIALNVDRPIVSLVGRDGWEALPPEERFWLTPARPASPDYRSYLYTITGGARPGRTTTGPDDPAFDRFVRAQQVWDRSFACAIADHLRAGVDGPIVALIGRGHLEYGYGTPDQLADLGIGPVVVALPGPSALAGPGPVADLVFDPIPFDSNA